MQNKANIGALVLTVSLLTCAPLTSAFALSDNVEVNLNVLDQLEKRRSQEQVPVYPKLRLEPPAPQQQPQQALPPIILNPAQQPAPTIEKPRTVVKLPPLPAHKPHYTPPAPVVAEPPETQPPSIFEPATNPPKPNIDVLVPTPEPEIQPQVTKTPEAVQEVQDVLPPEQDILKPSENDAPPAPAINDVRFPAPQPEESEVSAEPESEMQIIGTDITGEIKPQPSAEQPEIPSMPTPIEIPEIVEVPTPTTDDALEQQLITPTVKDVLENIESKTLAPPPLPSVEKVDVEPPESFDIPDTPLEPSGEFTRMAFLPGQTALTTELHEVLKSQVLPAMKSAPSVRLEIQAFATPNDTGQSSARRVSLERAIAIRAFLIEKNIEPKRIDIRALGEETSIEPIDRADLFFVRDGEKL